MGEDKSENERYPTPQFRYAQRLLRPPEYIQTTWWAGSEVQGICSQNHKFGDETCKIVC